MDDETQLKTDTWELLIPDFFPRSLNRTQDKHWSYRHRSKGAVMETLFSHCHQAGGVPVFEGFVWVQITRLWGKGQRKLDKVNLYGSVKQLEDCLRTRKQLVSKKTGKVRWQGGLGIIRDDDPDHCHLTVDQRKNDIEAYKGRECTMITIKGKLSNG